MQRWQLYFKFDHLPPHLRAISEPFAEAAKAIARIGELIPIHSCEDEIVHNAIFVALEKCEGTLRGCVDKEMEYEALREIEEAETWATKMDGDRDEAHRHLLRAKDCAVRAHLPDPETPQCG